MRPRGLPSLWRQATATYWYEKRQPTRAAELADAVADSRPASMLQPFTFALDDDEAELERVPLHSVDEARDAW